MIISDRYGYLIGRPINGVTLNRLEYAADDSGKEIVCSSIEEAEDYLRSEGVTDEEAERMGIRFVKVKIVYIEVDKGDENYFTNEKPCRTCYNNGWDMPQCRECNEKNGFRWYRKTMK